MTEFWRDERDARILSDDADVLLHQGGDPALGGYLYVRDEVLMTEAAEQSLRDRQLIPDLPDERDEMRLPELWRAGLRLYRLPGSGTDLPDQVRRLREVAQGDRGEAADVGLNHAMLGDPFYRGGPAGPPRPPHAEPTPASAWGEGPPLVVVLDTGIGVSAAASLASGVVTDPAPDDMDLLYAPPGSTDLAGVAGHGTFIAALIHRMSGGSARIAAERVLNPDGIGNDADIAETLLKIPGKYPAATVLNLSFGTYSEQDFLAPLGLRLALDLLPSRIAVVASAGNAGTTQQLWWPAAHERVVAVGSVTESNGSFVPSGFSNRGDWVDVCTFGEDVISQYVDGVFPDGSSQPPQFHGWAVWDGTSFAAPVVAAELVRQVAAGAFPDGRSAWQDLRAKLTPFAAPAAAVGGLGRLFDPRAAGFVGLDPRTA